MNASTKVPAAFHLPDGTSCEIIGQGEIGTKVIHSLAATMCLSPSTGKGSVRLVIQEFDPSRKNKPSLPLIMGRSHGQKTSCICQVLRPNNTIDLADQFRILSFVLASSSEARGGILLHGALAEKNGQGIILSGPSGVGKTTASKRLPAPWCSLSDDCTLIVLNKSGTYSAHPWPTWSSFYVNGEIGQEWDVQTGVPLKMIFMLHQSDINASEPLEKATAACMLNETAEQAWRGLNTEYYRLNKQQLRVRRFNNICKLTAAIPVHLLHLSKTGVFWEIIDNILS